jgi:signal recognition particle subunit SRP19
MELNAFYFIFLPSHNVSIWWWIRLGFLQLDKVYSRDNMQRGRVRVQLKREDESLVNPAVPSRKVLMMRVAELVGKLQSRHRKPEPTASTSGSAAPAGKSGKGGKKKR